MYLGDNLIMGGITDFVSEFQKNSPNSQILLARVDNPSEFGVAELVGRAGRAARGEARGARARTSLSWASTCSTRRSSQAVNEHPAVGARDELEITDAIQ